VLAIETTQMEIRGPVDRIDESCRRNARRFVSLVSYYSNRINSVSSR
jgi:hypothetical protein